MTDTITLTGVVGTTPRSILTSSGISISSFRLASSQRRYDRTKGVWVDGDTNWYTVTAFRGLADNVSASVGKGDRVLVTGRLRVRPWENGEKTGTTVEIDAEALGHDLFWGRSTFTREAVAKAAGAENTSGDGSAPDGSAPDGSAVSHDSAVPGDSAAPDGSPASHGSATESGSSLAPRAEEGGRSMAQDPEVGSPPPASPPEAVGSPPRPAAAEEWHSVGNTDAPF